MGCASHDDLSSSIDTHSARIAPHLNWQSDDYNLIEVPQIEDILMMIAHNIFYRNTMLGKIKILKVMNVWLNT
jgi:hypothetical protein